MQNAPTSQPIIFTSLLIGLIAVSFSAIFIEWSNAPAAIIGMYRLWMSVILFLPLAWKKRREFRQLSGKDILLLLLSGCFLGLHFLFWIQSLKETSVASSLIIISLEPMFVLMGAVLCFHERVKLRPVLCMAIAILGCALVASADFGQGGHHFYGDFLSFIGTMAVSVYMLAGQKVRKTVSGTTYNVLVFFIAGFVLFIFNVATRTPLVAYNGRNWLLFALLAVVSTVLGHGLFNWLLNSVSATTVAMTILGEPIGAIILAYFLLGQPINVIQALGGGVCLVSVFWFLRLKQSNDANHKHYPPGEETQPA